MSLSTQPYKGARDFYPDDKRLQKYMFGVLRRVAENFGYLEYDAPILEPLEIYLAKTGEEIVNEQLYSFTDKGDRQVAIRPEMTPSVSRLVAARRQELAYPLRLYSIPNLWRYERPQAGRLREHWQLNVDIFGLEGIEADHEIILIADSILKAFGAPADSYVIRISSRQLTEHFLHDHLKLSGRKSLDVQKLIDRKHKMPAEDFKKEAKALLGTSDNVNQLLEFISSNDIATLPSYLRQHSSVKELEKLFDLLGASGVEAAVFDASVVRGMEYYTDIVFEVFDADPSNLRSMFGGGRYDGLVGLFGVEPVPTVGFGMGDVTLQNFLHGHGLLPGLAAETDAVVILIGDVYRDAQTLLNGLRGQGVNLAIDSSQRKLDVKIRHAVKSGVRYALFIGEKELADKRLKLRDLQKGEEMLLGPEEIASKLLVRHKA
jgi:histidyl-tRNA synthetase